MFIQISLRSLTSTRRRRTSGPVCRTIRFFSFYPPIPSPSPPARAALHNSKRGMGPRELLTKAPRSSKGRGRGLLCSLPYLFFWIPLLLTSTSKKKSLSLSLSLSFSLLSTLTPPSRHSAWPSPAAATATASTALTARRRRPPRGTSKGCPPRLRPAAAAAAAAGARLEGKAT